jgi:hypothetical protein
VKQIQDPGAVPGRSTKSIVDTLMLFNGIGH